MKKLELKRIRPGCLSHKMLLVMKMSFLLLFAVAFQISATTLSQNISLEYSEKPIRDVLKELKAQTDVFFVYSEEDLDKNLMVSGSINNVPLEEALRVVLKDTGYDFKMVDDYVVIRPAANKAYTAGSGQQQPLTVSGRVTDEQNEPLPFVNLYVKGSTQGVITDSNGMYSIKIPDREGVVLVASFVGFATQEIPYAGQSTINITMKSEVADINEVVVTGYQTISRERSTGSFGRVDGKLFQERPNPDITTTMDGVVAGFQRTPKTNPDGSVTYNYTIRGTSTLTESIAKPLIVVDGFPIEGDFSSIDPNTIESVTVLKDASAASIWGARAANGVIVVVSSQGKIDSKITVEVNALTRYSPKLDLGYVSSQASTETQLAWERYVYDNKLTGNLTPSALAEVGTPLTSSLTLYNEYRSGNMTEQDYNGAIADLSKYDYRDDVEKYLLQMSKYQQYNVKVSGSSNNNNYMFSATYDIDDSYYKGDVTSKALINFRDNFQISKAVRFNAGATIKLQQNKNNGATLSNIKVLAPYQRLVDDNGGYTKMVKNYYLPIMSQVTEMGDFPYENWNYNLLQETRSQKREADYNTIRMQLGLNVKFLKHFVFDSKFQYELNTSEYEDLYSEESYLVRDQVNKYNEYDPVTGKVTRLTADGYAYPEGSALDKKATTGHNYVFRNQVQFDKNFGDRHNVTVLAGSEISKYTSEGNTQIRLWGYDPEKRTYANQPFYDDYGARQFYNTSKTRLTPGVDWRSSETDNRFFSLYGNFSYNYDSKYTLTASVRTDASNMIVKDPKYRYAPFWSVGARWSLENEAFMANLNWVDRMQLRASYGVAGNVVTSTSVLPLISYSSSPYSYTQENYARVQDYGNPLLRWEQTKTINVGLDFSLFNRNLYGKVDLYRKRGEDILANVDVPAVYGQGFNNAVNAAGLLNSGVEVELATLQAITKDLSWNGKLIFFGNKNEVKDLNVNSYFALGLASNNKYVEGASVSPLYSYIYKGESAEGIPMIQFENGQETEIFNIPTVGDARTFMKYEGTSIPRYELGFDNTFSFKGISLRFLTTGKFGHYFRAEAPNYSPMNGAGALSTLTAPMNEVMFGNPNKFPRLPPATVPDVSTYTSLVKYFDTLVEDASSIRMKEVTLSYDLPKLVINKIGLKGMRVFCQARDLGVIWKATDTRHDPDFPAYKPSESYTFGANVTF